MGEGTNEETVETTAHRLPRMPIAAGACIGAGKLAAALAQVVGAMNRVPKNGRNDFHKYDYATESDIMDAVRAELARVGVAIFPSVGEVTVEDTKDRGGPVTTVQMHVTFVHSSGEAMTTTWYGQGQDKTDKGYYKAYTGAMKYCLLKTFLMSTGDDPEASDADGRPTRKGGSARPPRPRAQEPEKRRARQAAPQAANTEPKVWSEDKEWVRLNKLIRGTLSGAGLGKADADKWLEHVKSAFGVASLTHLSPARMAKIQEKLQALGTNEKIVAEVKSKIEPVEVAA